MREFKRIIVGYDSRASSEDALQSALRLAQDTDAALKLVHVVESYPLYQRVTQPSLTLTALEDRVEKAGHILEARLRQPDVDALRAEYEIRTGKPFVELILAERAWRADLLVVGGTAVGSERLLGSTSVRLVRKAAAPVLVAKTPWTPTPKTFLVPTDFSDASREAAEVAFLLARQCQGRLKFLHVVEIPQMYAREPLPLSPLSAYELESEWETFLASVPQDDRVPTDFGTVAGRAATAIVQEAHDSQPDVIVMGTHGATRLAYMLIGSVAEEVVQYAPGSVLTVRPRAFQPELL